MRNAIMKAICILRLSNFRNYFLADVISMFGSGMSFVGANWYILKVTGSNASVGFLIMLNILGGFLAFPFGGTVADRYHRRSVLIVLNAVRGMIVGLVALAVYLGSNYSFPIYVFAFLGGAGWTFHFPASRGLMQLIVKKDDFIGANSLVEISMQVGLFTAGAMCGLLMEYYGFGLVLIIDAITFFVGMLFLYKIKHIPSMTSLNAKNEMSFYKQFLNGFAYLSSHKIVFIFGIAMFLPFVATMASNVVLPGYISDHLKAGVTVFGLASMFYGLGAFLSGFMVVMFSSRFGKYRSIISFFMVSIIGFTWLIFNVTEIGLYVAYAICGLGNSSLRIFMNSTAMEIVSRDFFGRTMAVWTGISMLIQMFVSYFAGIWMDNVSTATGYGLMSTLMIIGLIGCLILFPKLIESQLVNHLQQGKELNAL